MSRSFPRCGSLWLAAFLLTAAPASAQVVHNLHFGVGGFFPTGFNGRSDDDVLLRNAAGEPFVFDPGLTDALVFEMKDFRSAHFFGEWNAALSDLIEVGAGLGFSRKSVPTVYLDVVDDITGEDLPQVLRLRGRRRLRRGRRQRLGPPGQRRGPPAHHVVGDGVQPLGEAGDLGLQLPLP